MPQAAAVETTADEGLAMRIAEGAAVVGAAVAGAYALYRLTRYALAPRSYAVTHFLDGLEHAPFPRQAGPSAAVVVPSAFDPSQPLALWVYFRGHNSCVASIVGDVPLACSPRGKKRGFSKLATQLEASGQNALLVLPELKREAASGDPGAFRRAETFEAFVAEVFGRLGPLVPGLGARSLADVARLGLMSHSGGYLAVASVLATRPAPLRSVVLLDSLYGERAKYLAWIRDNAARLASAECRFGDVYTAGGGTMDVSQALCDDVVPVMARVGAEGRMLHDATTATLAPEVYADRSVIFKRSGLDHGAVSRYYPERFFRAGW